MTLAHALTPVPRTDPGYIATTMLAPPRSGLAAEMARFAAITEAWADMAEAAQMSDEAEYRSAKARFLAASGGQ